MLEIFDIYDLNGKVTGKTAVKGTKCTGNDYYLGVHVYIYNSNCEFLIQKRAGDKDFRPNQWEVLLEHAMTSEKGIDTAIRGVQEELGLTCSKEQFSFLSQIVWKQFHHLIDIFFLQADISVNDIIIQTQELSEVKWISKEEMLAMVQEMAAYRPQEYVDIVFNSINRL